MIARTLVLPVVLVALLLCAVGICWSLTAELTNRRCLQSLRETETMLRAAAQRCRERRQVERTGCDGRGHLSLHSQ